MAQSETQPSVSLLEKAVAVYVLAERCCDWVTGTVRKPRGKDTFAVGSSHQRTGENITD
jgi:hypothetical protein